jgi:hypothetical protein
LGDTNQIGDDSPLISKLDSFAFAHGFPV